MHLPALPRGLSQFSSNENGTVPLRTAPGAQVLARSSDRAAAPDSSPLTPNTSHLTPIISILGRITSSGRFIPAVDGLRFVAILSVVLYHLNDYLLHKASAFPIAEAKTSLLQQILSCGGCGVQLFFVISGFILGFPFAEHYLLGRRKPLLRQYFARRVLRIEPPYVINMLVAFCLLVLMTPAAARSLLPNLAASLCYVHGLVFGEMSRINCVAWSLEIEVQFYILAPFLATVFALRGTRLRRTVLLGALLLLIGLKTGYPLFWKQYFSATILSYLDFFLAGFLLADVYVATWNENPARTLWWDLISLAAWCAVLGVQIHDVGRGLLPLVILIAYVGAFRGVILHRIFSHPWIVTIGGMCYTIYLYHFFIISAVGRFTIGLSAGPYYLTNLLLQALLIVPCILAISAVLFLLFEKPFMVRDWPSRWKAAILARLSARRTAPLPDDSSAHPELTRV
ncbi:MAG: acyltransferase family protein [Thermoguttaceae bacterium]